MLVYYTICPDPTRHFNILDQIALTVIAHMGLGCIVTSHNGRRSERSVYQSSDIFRSIMRISFLK